MTEILAHRLTAQLPAPAGRTGALNHSPAQAGKARAARCNTSGRSHQRASPPR